MKKDNIFNMLVTTGRTLVKENGQEFLTARKLSDASKASVGTIYNLFGNMDNFIIVQNMLTLDEVITGFARVSRDADPYKNLNRYLDSFTNYVLNNQNLWFLLYNFHLKNDKKKLPSDYTKKIVQVINILDFEFATMFNGLNVKERKLSIQVLGLTLFALSSFLTTNTLEGFALINKRTLNKLLFNTYLAGIKSLKG